MTIFITIYENPCGKPDYFSINDSGAITVKQAPADGNYSVNIFAVDRFGLRALENLKIEVLGGK